METLENLIEGVDFVKNTKEPRPKHGSKGEYRTFSKDYDTKTFVLANGETETITYSTGSISGCDLYCENCNNYSTVKGTHFLWGVIDGACKVCGTSFITPEEFSAGKVL